jgi:hypothetical protein
MTHYFQNVGIRAFKVILLFFILLSGCVLFKSLVIDFDLVNTFFLWVWILFLIVFYRTLSIFLQ